MNDQPIPMRWTGDSFAPISGHGQKRADKQYVVGVVYPVTIEEQRSSESHKHEFAWLREAWQNLPESLADLFPTTEHLRKRALIEAGFYHETLTDCGSSAAALRVCAMLKHKDEFAYVIVRGPHVIERVAKSQSRRAMNKQEFQQSKTAIMDVIANMIGVKPEDLAEARAA